MTRGRSELELVVPRRDAVKRAAGAEARYAADTRRTDDRRQRRPRTHHTSTQEPAQLRHQLARRLAGAVRPADGARRGAACRPRRGGTLRALAVRMPDRLLSHRRPGKRTYLLTSRLI